MPIKVILPEGDRVALSIDIHTPCRLCIGSTSSCRKEYHSKVEAMLTKIPGFFFMSYRQIVFFNQGLISYSQYRIILDDLFHNDPDYEAFLLAHTTNTYNIPKNQLYVKFFPSVDMFRREVIANGIRAYF